MGTTAKQIEEVKSQIEELQQWFARKGFGWYDAASEQQQQQWLDREREQDRLIERLSVLEGR